jgi:hypothetical protein
MVDFDENWKKKSSLKFLDFLVSGNLLELQVLGDLD